MSAFSQPQGPFRRMNLDFLLFSNYIRGYVALDLTDTRERSREWLERSARTA